MSRKNTARKKRNVRLRLDNKNQVKETLYKIAIWWECVDCTCHPDPDPEQDDQFFKTPRLVGKWYESSITRNPPSTNYRDWSKMLFWNLRSDPLELHPGKNMLPLCYNLWNETPAFIGEKFKLLFEEKFEGTNIHLNLKNTAPWPVKRARRVELVLSERNPQRVAFVPLKLHPA